LLLERLEERDLLTYSVTDLGTLGGTGYTGSGASDVNDAGQVAGASYLPCNCVVHPFFWSGSRLVDLGVSGSAFGMNGLGQVVGYYNQGPFLWSKDTGIMSLGLSGDAFAVNNHTEVVGRVFVNAKAEAFYWKDGQAVVFDGYYSTAIDINDQGVVVGADQSGAFRWTQAGGVRHLAGLGTTHEDGAKAINNLGQIVGYSYSDVYQTTHAVYFSPTGPVDLGTLPGLSVAYDINDRGQVVGVRNLGQAFITDIYTKKMVDLNTLIPPNSGWYLGSASAINSQGQIVGSGDYRNQAHAYLLTPVAGPPAVLVTGGREAPPAPGTASDLQRSEARPVEAVWVAPWAQPEPGKPPRVERTPAATPASQVAPAPGDGAEGWAELADLWRSPLGAGPA
jgi:probable HAF family extracellular repeat protein